MRITVKLTFLIFIINYNNNLGLNIWNINCAMYYVVLIFHKELKLGVVHSA